MKKEKLLALCAKALHDVPHEKQCNTGVVAGLACTCELRAERLTQGFAAMLSWVASQRDNLKHRSATGIYDILIARFRNAAAADIKIRISVRRSALPEPGTDT